MRSTTKRALSTTLVTLTLALGAPGARGQTTTQAAAPAPALTPPRVTKFVEAERPSDGGDVGAVVDLDLTITADGTLADAKVVASAGAAFDRLALEAVRKFTFEPARRGERP